MIRRNLFDAMVWGVFGLCSFAVVAMLWINQQRGFTVSVVQPEDGASVSALTPIEVEFSIPMEHPEAESRLLIDPQTSGSISWRQNKMIFQPDKPLELESRYTVTLQAGAPGLKTGVVKADAVSHFDVRPPSILFLSPSRGQAELRQTSLSDVAPAPTVLTSTDGGIFDFALSPDGTQIAYSSLSDQNGIDLWLMSANGQDPKVLVHCGAAMCSNPAWSPDGLRLAYSRAEVPEGSNARPSPPRIWTVAISSGQTGPLFQDSQILGYSPTWSPDGNMLAFYDGNVGGIRALDLQNGQQKVLETQQGLVGAWSPDGSRMLFNVLYVRGNQTATELQLVDFDADELYSIIGPDSDFSDLGTPAWSPSGEWMALNLRTAESGLGKELWVMLIDGSEALPIAQDPNYLYSGYTWDPWGTAILFQRFPLGVGDAKPDLMLWRWGQREPVLIVQDAWLGDWLP